MKSLPRAKYKLIAGEKHLHFAVGKALRALAAGTNIRKDPGIEIMSYAAGERQIERSFSIGLQEGENKTFSCCSEIWTILCWLFLPLKTE